MKGGVKLPVSGRNHGRKVQLRRELDPLCLQMSRNYQGGILCGSNRERNHCNLVNGEGCSYWRKKSYNWRSLNKSESLPYNWKMEGRVWPFSEHLLLVQLLSQEQARIRQKLNK